MGQSFDKSAYDKEYAKQHVVRKQLPFNRLNPDDQRLLQWLDSQPNLTRYLKALIAADMDTNTRRSP